jgi:hypothetical protein
VLGGEQDAPEDARRQAHQDCAVGPGGVHDREGVGREFALRVGLDRRRTVRAAVAAPVERDHPTVARQVRNLRLPVTRVDD